MKDCSDDFGHQKKPNPHKNTIKIIENTDQDYVQDISVKEEVVHDEHIQDETGKEKPEDGEKPSGTMVEKSTRSSALTMFTCDICEKKFTTPKYLKVHIKTIHEGERNYKCESCGKSFTQSGSLMTHIKAIHEGQENDKCNSCGKSFNKSENLKRHIKTMHEGERNYECDSCGKSFNESGNLKNHIKTIHEGQKDHQCEFCETVYDRSG